MSNLNVKAGAPICIDKLLYLTVVTFGLAVCGFVKWQAETLDQKFDENSKEKFKEVDNRVNIEDFQLAK